MHSPLALRLLAFGVSLLAASPASAQQFTNVRGRLQYPSDWLPSQIVCAVPVNGARRICTKSREGAASFSLSLPPGRYFISAEYGNYKAWYTTGTACEGDYRCRPRDGAVRAIIVTVEKHPGDIKGICPCDTTQDSDIIF